jgi:hypothetical protein
MTTLKKKVEQIHDTAQLHNRLVELSIKEGGAWTFSIMPFSHEVHFYGAASPSKLPDSFLESTRGHGDYPHGRIGYKGKIIVFSEKAYIREQNRGIGGDR